MEWALPRRPPRRAARTDERLSVLSDLALGVAKGASGDFWEQDRDNGLDEDEADVLTASWTLNQGEGVVRRAGQHAEVVARKCSCVRDGHNSSLVAGAGPGPRRRRGGQSLARSNQRATKILVGPLTSGPRKFLRPSLARAGFAATSAPLLISHRRIRP